MIYDLRFTILPSRQTRSSRGDEALTFRGSFHPNFSLAPGFSPVTLAHEKEKPFKRFLPAPAFNTGLKAGANERRLA